MNKFLLTFLAIQTLTTAHPQSNAYRTDTVSISVYGGRLYGTLFRPSAPSEGPVVLIIPGSGPTDRNGNSNLLPGKNNSLLQLADSLAQYGIASLRYDKRGIGESVRALAKEESLVFEQNSADARSWLQYLYENGYRKIYVAGHSEGSLVALQVAQDFPLSGLISLAGAGRPIREVLQEQLATLPAPLKENAYRCMDSLAAGKRVKQPPLALLSLFRPSIQDYMISWLKLDPAKLIQRTHCPVLIIQGGQDLQVSIRDAQLLHAANPEAALQILPGMNHVLKSVPDGSQSANISTYTDPNQYVMTELVQILLRFIR